jgi:hypothetical protein
MLGDPNPHQIYGLSLSLEYKGFDFSINGQGVAGNSIVYSIRNNVRYYSNFTTDIFERWHGEGTSKRLPRVTNGADPNGDYKNVSDLLVFDGSYFKIRSINIGYDFSYHFIKNIVSQCRLYVSAINIYTFTKYPGLDPEVGYGDYKENRYANFSTGIDIGYYPLPVQYLIGLNIKF